MKKRLGAGDWVATEVAAGMKGGRKSGAVHAGKGTAGMGLGKFLGLGSTRKLVCCAAPYPVTPFPPHSSFRRLERSLHL